MDTEFITQGNGFDDVEFDAQCEERERNYEKYIAAVQDNGYALKDVPESMKTAEICLAAVQSGDSVLYYVPDALKTPELCRLAVKNEPSEFESVPDSLKDITRQRFLVT